MMWIRKSLFLSIALLASSAYSQAEISISGGLPSVTELVLERDSSGLCSFISSSIVQGHKLLRSANVDSIVEVRPAIHSESGSTNPHQQRRDILKIYGAQPSDASSRAEVECSELDQSTLQQSSADAAQSVLSASSRLPPFDIREIFLSGPSENRVNFIFFADGYTSDERDKFLSDATRLSEEISLNQTFSTVRPLTNFYAVFTASKESGIGTNGEPKATTFGLYRDGSELRGVYYNVKAARAACRAIALACDFPILLGNSPYYGGLGGEFTVITSSHLNGPIVLRHELGHSVLWVGEEYDGGGYQGYNADKSLNASLKWSHWLTKPQVPGESVRAERNSLPLLVYPWTLLNSSSPWRVTFATTGNFPRNDLRFSLSGVPLVSDLIIRLDGESLPWLPKPDIGMDRWFYDLTGLGGPEGLAEGEHVLEFLLTSTGRVGQAQVCNVEVIEYATEDEFNSTVGFIGAFPTYSDELQDPFFEPTSSTSAPKHWSTTSYRPTNEDCLMRQVATPDFCPVCKEAMWLELLKRIDLIDDLVVSCPKSEAGVQMRTFTLTLIPLAQFRTPARVDEFYEIEWRKDGHAKEELNGLTEVSLENKDSIGNWTVQVAFKTPEVRRDEYGFLEAHRDMSIPLECAH